MHKTDCTEGVTLEALLQYPLDLLVLRGAEGDEDDDDRDGDDEDEDPADKDKKKPKRRDGDEDEEDEDEDEDEPSDSDRTIQNLTEDRDRQWRKRKAAETDAADLRKQLAAAQANGTEDEELKKQVEKVSSDNERLLSQNRTLQLHNAFLTTSTISWEDPEAALALVDLSDVEITDDGKVEGMKVALDKLAKAKPYLVKKEGDKKPPRDPKRSGSNPGGRRSSQRTQAQQKQAEAELLKKYPALRKRR